MLPSVSFVRVQSTDYTDIACSATLFPDSEFIVCQIYFAVDTLGADQGAAGVLVYDLGLAFFALKMTQCSSHVKYAFDPQLPAANLSLKEQVVRIRVGNHEKIIMCESIIQTMSHPCFDLPAQNILVLFHHKMT